MKKYFSYIFLALIICSLLFASCGSKESKLSPNSVPNIKRGSAIVEKSNTNLNIGSKESSQKQSEKKEETKNTSNPSGRKIIQRGSIQLQALDFDKTIKEIISKVNSIGGYVESSNINGNKIEDENSSENRTASLTLRIPEKKLEEFMSSVGTLGNVLNKSLTGEDITDQYFDNEAHLKALKIQEDRLLELLKKSGELKDILEIEKELTRVRYEVENLTGSLKKFDSLIQYSTINIKLQEVEKFQKANPVSLNDKIYKSFKDSIENIISILKWLLITVVSLIPYLIIIVPITFITKYILRKKHIQVKNPFKRNKNN
ncbi:DUF4349 domain-containing protein [Clostridium lundense]|uniref:DUF4349 domain-containing protein n=1 Tax=Clostridium lundense TaxID=319475 RepID=UPI0006862EB8|nr:DUF4349 domain-containing protein [Clostridium lundense]